MSMEQYVIDHYKNLADVEAKMATLVALGVGIAHVNRCARIGFALQQSLEFLDDCAQRIAAGMPMDEFCGYIDDYENPAIGIEKAPRTINTPYFVSARPVSVGYSVGDLATEIAKVAKQADEPKKKQKNALRFLDGLGYRNRKF